MDDVPSRIKFILEHRTALQLEERIAQLEMEMLRIKQHLQKTSEPPILWWQTITNTFANDPAFDEAMELVASFAKEWEWFWRKINVDQPISGVV